MFQFNLYHKNVQVFHHLSACLKGTNSHWVVWFGYERHTEHEAVTRAVQELREKIIIKSKGYMSIAKLVHAPLTTPDKNIQMYKVHGAVANLPGRGRKMQCDPRLIRWIVGMVEKEQ